VGEAGEGRRFRAFFARTRGALGFEKDVVVKVVKGRDAEALAWALEGAKRAMALSHASVLRVLNVGHAVIDGTEQLYWITELARGASLAKLVAAARARRASIPAPVMLSVGAAVAEALDHAHRRQAEGRPIAHGALDAKQVFLTDEGAVQISDFCLHPAPADPAEDLVALGRMLASAAGADVPGPARAVLRALEEGAVTDAGVASERLHGAAYELSPTPLGRSVRSWLERARDLGSPAPSCAAAEPPRHEAGRAPGSRLVGRDVEMRALAEAFERTRARGPLRAVVVGPAGIGKSKLLAELERRTRKAEHARAILVRGAPPPFDLVALVSRALGALVAGGEEETGPPALARRLEMAAQDRPLVLCIDDADLVDPDGLAELHAALGLAAPATRVLCVEAGRVAARAAAPLEERTLRLGEIDDEAIGQIVAVRLGARLVPPEIVEPLSAAAGGNPWFVEQALRDLEEQALVEVSGGVARLCEGAAVRVPESLGRLVGDRIARQSEAIRAALEAAAVLGPGAQPVEIARLALLGEGEDVVRAALIGGAFAREDETGGLHLATSTSEQVLALASPERVRDLHARAAALLGGDDAVLPAPLHAKRARHLERSGAPAAAARADLRAARSWAKQDAPIAAAAAYVRAIRGLDEATAVYAAVSELGAIAARTACGPVDLEEALPTVLALVDAALPLDARLLTRVRLARLCAPNVEAATVLLDQAESLADVLSSDSHPDARALPTARTLEHAIHGARLSVAADSGDAARGLPSARRIVEDDGADVQALADAARVAIWSDDLALARAAVARLPAGSDAAARLSSEILAAEGRYDEAAALLASVDASNDDDTVDRARAALQRALVLIAQGDEPRAFAALTDASRRARSAGALDVIAAAARELDGLAARHEAAALERLAHGVGAAKARGRAYEELVLAALLLRARRARGEPVAAEIERLASDAERVGHLAMARALRRP
jgi:hypothetical protein